MVQPPPRFAKLISPNVVPPVGENNNWPCSDYNLVSIPELQQSLDHSGEYTTHEHLSVGVALSRQLNLFGNTSQPLYTKLSYVRFY